MSDCTHAEDLGVICSPDQPNQGHVPRYQESNQPSPPQTSNLLSNPPPAAYPPASLPRQRGHEIALHRSSQGPSSPQIHGHRIQLRRNGYESTATTSGLPRGHQLPDFLRSRASYRRTQEVTPSQTTRRPERPPAPEPVYSPEPEHNNRMDLDFTNTDEQVRTPLFLKESLLLTKAVFI